MEAVGMLGIIGSAVSAGASMLGAVAKSDALKAEAAAGQQKAAVEKQWADRRAGEERAAAQRAAFDRAREGRLAESKLVAMAGASGGRVDDPTIGHLAGGIAKESLYNQGKETAAGAQRASALEYQGNLGVWGADAEAQIKKAAAKNTLISGILGAAGSGLSGFATAMGRRYDDPSRSGYNTTGGLFYGK